MADTLRIYIATTNPGKLREFREAALAADLSIASLPGMAGMPSPVENGDTFEANARIKAEYYSRGTPGEWVLAEDSGLEVEGLGSAPGVYSARYAAALSSGQVHPDSTHQNSDDAANNAALVQEMKRLSLSTEGRCGKYVCVIAIARDGKTLQTFRGEVAGQLLTQPRGSDGFGYDPLFYFPALDKTFAELPLEEKRQHSHRGNAFRAFLEWFGQHRVELVTKGAV
ncbi:MAG TPA: RdgB/HAM1 family non-canonical purine NTP pyrophosphatase [Candidatus Angelobacter sp.]|nr:RdgB/HAM1 family non-canonical purine NTP pyrophosphatase [Candidatus Angelobacter sp.]